jgi:multidrug efflux pump subunit AcrA (membrane-fusion protein)
MHPKRFVFFLPWLIGVLSSVLIFISGCKDSTDSAPLTVKPQKGPFVVSVVATGELNAQNSIDIEGPTGIRKAGLFQLKITDLVAEGTVVKPGDVVAQLDKAELLSKLKEVEMNLQKFTSQYTGVRLDCTLTLAQARDELVNLRYAMEQRKLEKDESVYEAPSTRRQAEIEADKAVRAYDQAKINYSTKVKQAEAKMREAEAELNKEKQNYNDILQVMGQFTITATEPGMVIYAREWDGKKRIVGSTINAWDMRVATLPDLSKMQSVTHVNEVDIKKIRVGQKVKIKLDADSDKKLTGEITSVANIGEQHPSSESKVFEVVIKVLESDSTLRPAMTTSNEIMVETIENAMFIPLETVHSDDQGLTFVYIKDGSGIKRKQVELGLENDNHVVVKAGLTLEEELYLSKPDGAEDAELIMLKP